MPTEFCVVKEVAAQRSFWEYDIIIPGNMIASGNVIAPTSSVHFCLLLRLLCCHFLHYQRICHLLDEVHHALEGIFPIGSRHYRHPKDIIATFSSASQGKQGAYAMLDCGSSGAKGGCSNPCVRWRVDWMTSSSLLLTLLRSCGDGTVVQQDHAGTDQARCVHEGMNQSNGNERVWRCDV